MRRLPLRSPPRMRGKVHPAHHAEQGDGITPAYAGKSFGACIADAVPPGSPPRVRGKVIADAPDPDEMRITPAYAGKSFGSFCFLSFRQDHPRVCGEKQAAVALPQPVLGSPPRMRGKACLTLIIRLLLGITPAHAGKSLPAVLKCPPTRDHPRVCGEKRRVRSWRALLLGSPPRMRGKVGLLHGHIIAIGITPAHAGKRRSIGRLSQPTRDHPRVCGEKCSSVRSASHRRGSPPRVRGKVCDLTIIRVHHGITPAYAGKRLKRSHSIGHFSCILCLFHSVLHRASVSGGSRAGPRAPPCLPAQNTVPV